MKDTIKLTGLEKKQMDGYEGRIKSYNDTIRMLSIFVQKEEQNMWEFLAHTHPELAGQQFYYDRNGTLIRKQNG